LTVDALDRILAAHETVTPSPWFCASVMARVRREATTPPPLAFPWRIAIPAIAFSGILAGIAIWVAITSGGAALAPGGVTPPGPLTGLAGGLYSPAVAWASVVFAVGWFLGSRLFAAVEPVD
jgi:hypothetical protein